MDYVCNDFRSSNFVMIGGGVNTLYCCHLHKDEDKSDALVVRVLYKDKSEDHKQEEFALRVAQATGCGQPLYATFNNGFVIGYAQGRLITWNELWDPHIAK